MCERAGQINMRERIIHICVYAAGDPTTVCKDFVQLRSLAERERERKGERCGDEM